MNWTPIETAPRDGSHILVADFTTGAVGFGKYSGKTQPWQCVVHWWGVSGQEGFYPSTGSSDRPVKATHWMPLPGAADQSDAALVDEIEQIAKSCGCDCTTVTRILHRLRLHRPSAARSAPTDADRVNEEFRAMRAELARMNDKPATKE